MVIPSFLFHLQFSVLLLLLLLCFVVVVAFIVVVVCCSLMLQFVILFLVFVSLLLVFVVGVDSFLLLLWVLFWLLLCVQSRYFHLCGQQLKRFSRSFVLVFCELRDSLLTSHVLIPRVWVVAPGVRVIIVHRWRGFPIGCSLRQRRCV